MACPRSPGFPSRRRSSCRRQSADPPDGDSGLDVPGTSRERAMHYSRLCAVLIDCNTSDVDEAAHFWARALGRAVDITHPGSRGNYRMLETPADESSSRFSASTIRAACTSTSRPTTFPRRCAGWKRTAPPWSEPWSGGWSWRRPPASASAWSGAASGLSEERPALGMNGMSERVLALGLDLGCAARDFIAGLPAHLVPFALPSTDEDLRDARALRRVLGRRRRLVLCVAEGPSDVESRGGVPLSRAYGGAGC